MPSSQSPSPKPFEQPEPWRDWGGPQVRVRCLNPGLSSGSDLQGDAALAAQAFLKQASTDAFIPFYRTDVLDFHDRFISDQAPSIDSYVTDRFGTQGPRHLVSSGIGANEQFTHLLSELNNQSRDRKLIWIPVNCTREMDRVPRDAALDNTLFLECSRSGITEETVKLHEFTPRHASRVVFANKGPLRQLAERDHNLALTLPDEVPGRFGRNKSPILLAPMHIAGLDTRAYWSRVDRLCRDQPLSDPASLPVRLAAYIRAQQLRCNANHIYLATNHPLLLHSADEFCQFWNEGPNKNGNDILISRYLGLPRDSHMNLEGILANHRTRIAIFLIATGPDDGAPTHPLLCPSIDTVNPAHADLSAHEQDLILTLANAQRCSELMPTILITVPRVDLEVSALLGQLWADLTFVYSRLVGVDPGSNPEVQAVRTRAADWLADKAAALKLLQ